jgi:hypothetical protein
LEVGLNQKAKYSLYSVITVFILIQFVPVNRDNPSVDLELVLKAPPEVTSILENSCYDCHSNQTNWPFYSYIAPVSWLVARDVNKA